MPRQAVFVGVARDCAQHLPGVLANLDRFAATYDRAAFLFAVSDSTDDTRPLLEGWLAAGPRPGRVLELGTLATSLPRRTERIAHARNALLDALRAGPWAGHDHLIVADLDDVLAAPVGAEPFARASAWLAADAGRAAVLASAMPRYYDVWALRHETWCPGDCWHPIWGRPPSESFEAAKFREVFARQIVLPPSLPPVRVLSAFGGLGLYRMDRALAARYRGLDGEGREVSEHVAFNADLRRAGGQIHIFPPLQVHAPAQHLYDGEDFTLRWRLAMLARRALEWRRPPWHQLVSPS